MKLIKQKFDYLQKSKFVRGVVVLATGTVAAQLVGILVTPLITRLYGPEEFGQLGVFMNILSVMTPLVALCYPIAIVLPKEKGSAVDVARLALFITCIVSLFSLLLLLFTPSSLLVNLGFPAFPLWLWAIPFALFFGGILQICQQWMIREKQFGMLAKASFYQSIFVNVGKIVLGAINPVGIMLIVMATLASIIHAVILFPGLKTLNKGDAWDTERIKSMAKQYIDFPIYRAPQTFINALSQGFPVFFIASFFGVKEAGFYTLATSIMGIPTALIGKSINDVFYPRIAEMAYKGGKVGDLLVRSSMLLAGLGFFPYTLIFFMGAWVFSLVFGSEWAVAGEYACWLSLWFYSMLFTTTCASSLPVLGIQKFGLIFTVFKITIRALVVYIGCFIMKNPLDVVWLLGVSGFVVNVIFLVMVLRAARGKDASLI